MTLAIRFDAAGNDVLIVDGRTSRASAHALAAQARRADIHSKAPEIYAVLTGVNDIRVDFWNPDGSREELCGNALRSLGHYLASDDWRTVSTARRKVLVRRTRRGGAVALKTLSISVSRQRGGIVLVDPGTPHIVRVVDNLDIEQVAVAGREIISAPRPANATFVVVRGKRTLVRVFERGVGETKSCGTGAISAFLARQALGLVPSRPRIDFVSGSSLFVSVPPGTDHIVLDGVLRRTDSMALD